MHSNLPTIYSTQKLQLIIVEDSEDDALLLLRELKRSNYEPIFTRVDNSTDMLAALEKKNWDLIVSDYSLPHFGAPAALKIVQASKLDLPFIIVSGTIGEETAVAAMKAGAHDFIPKDKLARLVPAIERELREADMRRERREAIEQIELSLKEKEVLLKEIHHRVKNNLQIICSLLNLQAEVIEDPRVSEIFRESQSRIQSMALIHEKLYHSEDLASVNFCDYLNDLVTNLRYSYQVNLDSLLVTLKIEQIELDIDTAIPCGLIVNELVSNALKYAFSPSDPGELRIELYAVGDREYTLIVSDTGVGFPPELDFRQTKSLGLQLVNSLVKQLEGSIELNRDKGTEFKIWFPKQN